MLIGEAMKKTGLTRKAILYYEEEGLINPKVDDNRYRHFDREDIDRLKEISVLRFNGLSINEIRRVLESEYKLQELERIKNYNDFKIREYEEKNSSISRLEENYDIELEFKRQEDISRKLNLKERLLESFPLSYLAYMIINLFDNYLEVDIVGDEEERAYEDIIVYLDGLDLKEPPEELKEYIEELYLRKGVVEFKKVQDDLLDYMSDLDSYKKMIEDNEEVFLEQLEYFASEDYKSTDSYRMNILMSDYLEKIDIDYIEDRLKVINPEYKLFTEEFTSLILEVNKIKGEE